MILLASFFFFSIAIFSQTNSAFSKKNEFGNREKGGSIFMSAKSNAGLSSYNPLMINTKNSATWIYNPNTLLDFTVVSNITNIKLADDGAVNFFNTALSGINWVSQIMDSTLSIGITLSPFISRNGQFKNEEVNIPVDISKVNLTSLKTYKGSIAEFKFGTSYRFSEDIAASVDLLYYFGSLNIERKDVDSKSNIFIAANDVVENTYWGLKYQLNLLYQITDDFNIAVQFSPAVMLKRESEGVFVTSTNVYNYDIKNVSDIEIPAIFVLGLGERIHNFGKLYFDYQYESWNYYNVVSNSFSLGYESFSSENQFDPLVKRATFFMGTHYNVEGFKYHYSDGKPENVRNIGFSVGVAIPFNFNRNVLSLGLSYNKRGSSDKNGVSESVYSFNIGISLGEWWYITETDD